MTNKTDILTIGRAYALFTSDLSGFAHPSRSEVTTAIRHAVRRYGGIRGCAGEVAAAYGDHPESAVVRMRWARHTVDLAYSRLRDSDAPAHHPLGSTRAVATTGHRPQGHRGVVPRRVAAGESPSDRALAA